MSEMNKKLRTFVYPVCAFIVLLLLWQVCVMLSTSEIAFPTPVAVFKEFFYILTHKVGNYYTVVGHVLWSLSRVLVGFSIAAVLGIILGPIAEENFLRGKMIADTDVGVFSYFFTGGLNLALIALCLLSLTWGIYSEVKYMRNHSRKAAAAN